MPELHVKIASICVALRQKSGGKTAESNLLHRLRRRRQFAIQQPGAPGA